MFQAVGVIWCSCTAYVAFHIKWREVGLVPPGELTSGGFKASPASHGVDYDYFGPVESGSCFI